MGKGGNASAGGQATAKAKAEPAAKDGGKKGDGKTSKVKDEKAGNKAAEPKVDEAQVKLTEEAQQAYADDEKAENNRIAIRDANRQIKEKGWKELGGNRKKGIADVTRFQNKLKLFKGEAEFAALEKDIDGVDASKYVPELADCIMEAIGPCLKLKELPSGVKLCTRLRATYEDFGGMLVKALEKAYAATPATDLNRRRFLVRMVADLVLVECIPAEKSLLASMLKELTDISASEETIIINFQIIASLVQKHALSCFNVVPEKHKAYEEVLKKPWVERKCVLGDELRSQLLNVVVNAYQQAAGGLLQTAHGRLVEQEKENTKLRVDKGEVDKENAEKHAQLKEAFAKLQKTFTEISEHLNQPVPEAQEEDPNATRLAGPVVERVEEEEKDLALLWEDSEQQKFYEEVLEPKDVIPAVLLTGGKQAKEEIEEKPVKEETKEEKDEAKAQIVSEFDVYLSRVSKAESAKQVDEVVIEFFHEYNTKGNRRQLAYQLYGVPRNKLHMLAPHARLLAIVAPYMKDLTKSVVTGLQKEVEQFYEAKDPIAIENKIKTVRYLCELCKFKVCPPGVILDMLNKFCDDLSHHHAELCANILQCCGRFLCYTPETSVRTENLMERIMRLKNAKSLPLRLEIMLEDAYYQVKPPESKRQAQKEKDPLHLFVQHLIWEMMYRDEDEDKVLKLARKLPWDGPAPGWLKKCLLDLNMHANYENLYLTASLLSGLAKYRDSFVIETIDTLFENIQTTLERNDFREMPLRVRQVKLVGELYNYRLVDSQLIFDSLYQFIGQGGPSIHKAGHTVTAHRIMERALVARKGNLGAISEEAAADYVLPAIFADPQHPLEAPWDYFRIKLVCVMLETCGHYFDRGAVKQKLDRFLHFFCRYVHTKGDLPLRFMNMVYDTLERIRPKMTFPETKAIADEAVLKILRSERETLDLGDGQDEQDDDGEAGDDGESSEEDDSGSDEDESSDDEDEESESEEESDSEVEDEDYERQGGGYEAEGKKTQHEEELDSFDKEMQQLLIDSLERETKVSRASQRVIDLPPPPPPSSRPEGTAVPGVFSLLQKKGGKVAMKQIDVPDDSKLARVVNQHLGEQRDEKQDIKRFVMNYDASMPSGPTIQVLQPGRHQIGLRAGKGGHKGHHSMYSSRRNQDYVKTEFLPSAGEEPPPLVQTMRVSYKGKGKGKSSREGGGGKGGGGKGGGPRGPDSRGTPPAPSRSAFD